MSTVFIPSRGDLEKVRSDFRRSFSDLRPWLVLSFFELRQTYRRSFFGVLWMPVSTAVVVLVMGFLISAVWGNPIERFLPFLAIGLIIWNYINNTVQTCAQTFTSNADTILQFDRPYSSYILKTVASESIRAAHSVPVFLIVAITFGILPSEPYFLLLLSIPLLILNLTWMGLLIAVITVRFRDVSSLVQNLFTPLFWLTPVLYEPETLSGRVRDVINLNPLTHILEVVRSPFLNQTPSTLNWFVAIGVAIAGWVLTILFFARFRSRIAYWL